VFQAPAELGVVAMAAEAHRPGLFIGRQWRFAVARFFSPPADIFPAHACGLGSGTTPYDALAASVFTRCAGEVGSR